MESRMGRRMSKEVLEKAELLKLSEIESVDDFSYAKVEMLRGETPANITEKCFELCQNYIGGTWLNQTLDTVHVKRLSGGLTNQLYYCGLNDPSTADGVPDEVAIRLYGPKHFNNEEGGNERLTDLIIALMVSENKLGPKVYGAFEEGQIQNFIKHRHFRYDEQRNPKLADQLFRKIARVHAMDVPIKKNTNWVFTFFETFYEKAYQRFPINQMLEQMNLVTLRNNDVKKELEWLKKTIIELKSPIVFSHLDFRGTNCMVTEPNDEITLCDFEYSCYGYRGFDLGTMMVEWNIKVDELFKATDQVLKYPNDEQLKTLLKSYINESEIIFGKKYSENKINSLDHLMKEVKVFSLVADMFIVLFSLKCDEAEDGFPLDKKIMLQMGERNYQGYFSLKKKFNQENVFK